MSSNYDFEKPKTGYSYTYDEDDLAGLGERLIALIIDSVIVGIIGGVFFGVSGDGGTGGIVGFLVGVAYQWYFLTQQDGQTLGKKMMGIRVVKLNGAKLEAADVIVRYVGYYINSIIAGLGWIWAAFDSKKQGLHDKLASTIVVKA
ncbi:MAG: RDD family protein [Anaerolinea sp.]|nr:RDD family protein [Anaerolinea sp.]